MKLTSDEIMALSAVLSQAFQDQQIYLEDGNKEADYGDEWTSVAIEKAENLRQVASVLEKLGCESGAIDAMNLAAEFEIAVTSLEVPSNEF